MTGPEHYRKAEDFLRRASENEPGRPDSFRADLIRGAQAHATLALVAATRATAGPWNRAFDLDPGETS